jgi:hypothetical protein
MKLSKTPDAGNAEFEPRRVTIREPYPFIAFRLWWDSNIIFKDSRGETFTRRTIVLAVANQDGGSHVDPELDAEYAGLSKENSLGWTFRIADKEVAWPNNPVPASVRQIAHETLVTLAASQLIESSEDD